MPRAFLTAIVATLALGSFAPRLAAQDTTSATGQARPDTSGYTGAGGVDTTMRPGRVGATDTIRLGGDSALTGDSVTGGGAGIDTRGATAAPSPLDTTTSADPSRTGTISDSAGVLPPTTRPRQGTSPSGTGGPSADPGR